MNNKGALGLFTNEFNAPKERMKALNKRSMLERSLK